GSQARFWPTSLDLPKRRFNSSSVLPLPVKPPQKMGEPIRPLVAGGIEPLQSLPEPRVGARAVRNARCLDGHVAGNKIKRCFSRNAGHEESLAMGGLSANQRSATIVPC